MIEKIDRVGIVEYLNGLDPKNPLEVVKVSSEVKTLVEALVALSDRVNSSRQVKLWTSEISILKDEIEKLSFELEEAQRVDSEQRELANQKANLLAQKAEIQDLTAQKEEIFNLKAFVANHNIAKLREELGSLNNDLGGDINQLTTWVLELRDFFSEMKSGMTQEVGELLKTLLFNQQKVEEMLKEAKSELNEKKAELLKSVDVNNVHLQEAQSSYNDLVNQLNNIKIKLHEIREKHPKNIVAYETHFAQNKMIWGELGKRHNIDDHLKTLMDNTETNLRNFDREIKVMLDKVDHLIVF